mmetsp:Transcript_77083/g.249528  ORF Transcript_77083/g.249528 Transcript_77083/m.249528 type:complete len:204 (+) Transcript_77083:451-1062(+)
MTTYRTAVASMRWRKNMDITKALIVKYNMKNVQMLWQLPLFNVLADLRFTLRPAYSCLHTPHLSRSLLICLARCLTKSSKQLLWTPPTVPRQAQGLISRSLPAAARQIQQIASEDADASECKRATAGSPASTSTEAVASAGAAAVAAAASATLQFHLSTSSGNIFGKSLSLRFVLQLASASRIRSSSVMFLQAPIPWSSPSWK